MAETTNETAFEFPCRFPIKAMGKNRPDMDVLVAEIVRRHVDDLTEGAVTSRESKGGKYISVTVVITAQSKKQLDAVYRDLTACSDVIMTL